MNKTTCKYYNGDHHNTHCEAGVEYRSVTSDPDNKLGAAFRKPCIDWGKFKAGSLMSPLQQGEWEKRGTCSKFELPTTEEVEAYEKMVDDRMKKMVACMEVIAPLRKQHKGQNWSGIIECPSCKGKLHIRHAAYNGHIWGKCETDDCLSWIE